MPPSHKIEQVNSSITLILTSIFYAFQMTLRVMPVVMFDYLAKKVSLDPNQLGLLAGIYYIGYCMGHIPIGVALDRFHPRYVISLCLLLCVGGLYLTSFASSTFEIFLARFLIGVGSAAGILGAIKVICDFYTKIFGVMLGLTILIGIFGAYYGAEPLKGAVNTLSYDQAIEGLILFGIILAASIFAFYPAKLQSDAKIYVYDALFSALKSKKLWSVGICAGLMVGPIEGFSDLWGAHYLTQIHNMSYSEATFSISLIFIGLGIGCPLCGYLNNHFKLSSRTISYFGILMLIMSIILFWVTNLSPSVIYILSFMIGLLSAYQILAFIIMHKLSSSYNVSISMAILNMIIMIFGFIYHSIIGFVLDTFFISSTTDALVYGADAYQTAFSVIIIGIAIGIIGFYKMRDRI